MCWHCFVRIIDWLPVAKDDEARQAEAVIAADAVAKGAGGGLSAPTAAGLVDVKALLADGPDDADDDDDSEIEGATEESEEDQERQEEQEEQVQGNGSGRQDTAAANEAWLFRNMAEEENH